jgi:hypothetical protein
LCYRLIQGTQSASQRVMPCLAFKFGVAECPAQ